MTRGFKGLPAQRIGWKPGVALFKRFWVYVRPDRRFAWLLFALLLLAIPGSVASPLLIRQVFDEAIPGANADLLIELAIGVACLTVASQAFRYIAGVVATGMQMRMRYRLSRSLFAHVLHLPLKYFHATETGYVMARIREDVGSLDALTIDSLVSLLVDVLRAALFFGILLSIDAGLATAGLILLAVVFACVLTTSKALRARSVAAQEASALTSTSLHQSLTGIPTVRTTAQEQAEKHRYARVQRDAVRAAYRRDFLHSTVHSAVGLATSLGIYLILMYGAWRIIETKSTVGTLFAFSIYLTSLGAAISSIMSMNPAIQRALASLQRIFALQDEAQEATPELDEAAVETDYQVEGRVEFDRVSFTYGDGTVALADVSLAVEPGEVIALVGRSGAGKSTLVHMIPRLYDPTNGEIRIDGVRAQDHPLRLLRRRIGVVPQDVFLFNRTVKENIAYATPNATEDEIVAAAKAAHADEFIRRLKDGYSTLVGERGVKLSGGEKQRIAIAREILRNPAILILDEATSSLDSESEALIQDAIERLKKDRTCFVIAHRLSTVQDADRIVVVERGRIVEVGRHAELLERDGIYRKLHATQFGTEDVLT